MNPSNGNNNNNNNASFQTPRNPSPTTTRRVSKTSSSSATGNATSASPLRSYPMKRTKRTYHRSPQLVPLATSQSENKENLLKDTNSSSVKPTKRALAASEIMNETTMLDLFHTSMCDATMDITKRVNNESGENL
ncbi:meiosis inducing protein Mei3 [Schizosaccharomyces cryophilus OY26]|uniref:Meiosis inducing protein Mei3 n=1 Tax=Schizosaccharomyces cryophilus (strain OY26 / ATCC MYA-4695 / CBS 11777 / NBRC 106824 / NRRL Y48691) TaxID=653667 RepID=S9W118_SCHCR|nr:meiosis inducing protein Mei3 [Schizosaccharomyces cryophilus OY26]EPY53598.1 meiosis inducing protein Mei3 [Schizosaccharomyces cryophilus OY26]